MKEGENKNIIEEGDLSALIVSVEEFVSMCEMGYITEDDGIGYYGSRVTESEDIVYPSEVSVGRINKIYSHVWWYNK